MKETCFILLKNKGYFAVLYQLTIVVVFPSTDLLTKAGGLQMILFCDVVFVGHLVADLTCIQTWP